MVATAINNYLKNNGIKQTFLCKKTGFTRHCISYSLTGKRKLSIDEYVKICKVLKVPYEYFFNKSK